MTGLAGTSPDGGRTGAGRPSRAASSRWRPSRTSRSYLLLTVDAAACDGWSVGVLRSEVAAAYAGAVTRRRVRLPHLPLQYRDFASAQRAAG